MGTSETFEFGETVGDNLCGREKQTEGGREGGKSEQVEEKQATKGL